MKTFCLLYLYAVHAIPPPMDLIPLVSIGESTNQAAFIHAFDAVDNIRESPLRRTSSSGSSNSVDAVQELSFANSILLHNSVQSHYNYAAVTEHNTAVLQNFLPIPLVFEHIDPYMVMQMQKFDGTYMMQEMRRLAGTERDIGFLAGKTPESSYWIELAALSSSVPSKILELKNAYLVRYKLDRRDGRIISSWAEHDPHPMSLALTLAKLPPFEGPGIH